MDIAILGQGAWGTALALHAARAHRVRWWGRNPALCQELAENRANESALPGISIPPKIEITEDIRECVDGCDWTVLAVPVAGVPEVADLLKSLDVSGLVWTCKGMDLDSGRFPSEILDETLGPTPRRAALSGPSFADDLAVGRPVAVVVAAEEIAMAEAAAEPFRHGALRVYASDDPIGVQLGGAMKNVLAIAVGIAHGLQLGDSARAALITRGLNELMRLGQALGADPSTLTGLAGLGDLALTCSGAHSRNFRLGQMIGEGQTAKQASAAIGQVTEGRHTALALDQLSKKHDLELPICEQVRLVLTGAAQPIDAVKALLARPPGPETRHA